ncbi:MAG: chemotaxis protein CheA [Nitrospinae bacterium]|nr:chemotaxis protein CheA [Nitrospinota bacterium]
MNDKKISEFLAEGEEIFEELSKSLLLLESEMGGASSIRPETLNSIFRSAHSLKGLAGLLGFPNISDLSHNIENILDEIRMGRISLNSIIMDILFEGIDLLRRLMDDIGKGIDDNGINTKGFISKINNILTEKAKKRNVKSSFEGLNIPPEITNILTEYEEHRLLENIKQKIRLFEVMVSFNLDTFDNDLKSVNESLSTIGEVITTLPITDKSPDVEIQFKLILGTMEDKEKIISILKLCNLDIREIEYVRDNIPQGEAIMPPRERGEESILSQSDVKSLSKTVRVDIDKLDTIMNIVGELVLNKSILTEISRELRSIHGFTGIAIDLHKTSQTLDKKVRDLQQRIIEVRMVPIGQLFDRFFRVIRRYSKELGKDIRLEISGGNTQLDKLVVEDMADPLMHLIRNSIDHGIEIPEERRKKGKSEVGTIRLNAMQKGSHVVIEVEDDGEGIDIEKVRESAIDKGLIGKDKELNRREILDILFTPGFSTSKEVSNISGRGVGLDVVKRNIADLSGMIDIETEEGKGTRFTITLPITLAIIRALIVRVANTIYAIPVNSVLESLMITPGEIKGVERREVMQFRDRILPLFWLKKIFNLSSDNGDREKEYLYVVVAGLGEKRIGLVVDGVEREQDIVIKSIGDPLKNIQGIIGAAELGNRKTILVMDVGGLIKRR